MAEGLIVRDASGIITDCNAAASRSSASRRDRLRGRRPEDVLGAGGGRRRSAGVRRSAAGRRGAEHGRSAGPAHGAPDATGRHAGLGLDQLGARSSTPAADAEGVVSTMSDVTQSREAEQRLVASERRRAPWRTSRPPCAASPRSSPARRRPSAVFEQVTEEVARLLDAPSARRRCATRTTAAPTVVGSWTRRRLGGPAAGLLASTLDGRLGRRPRLPQRPARAHRQLRRRAGGALAERLRGLRLPRPRWPLRSRVGGQAVGRAGGLGPRSPSDLVERLRAAAVATSPSSSRRPCPTPTPTTSSPASRARIVEAGDAERRRLERNLHDGAQQRLVALALQLRMVEAAVEANPGAPAQRRWPRAREQLEARARGAARAGPRHPSRDPHRRRPGTGRRGARRTARRCRSRSTDGARRAAARSRSRPRPTTSSPRRSPTSPSTPQASHVSVSVLRDDGRVLVEVADDGVGGADPPGLGPARLADRSRRSRALVDSQPVVATAGGADTVDERGAAVGGMPGARGGLARAPVGSDLRPLGVDGLRPGDRPCRGRTSAPSRAPAGSRSRCSSPRRWRSPAPRRRASGSWSCGPRVSRRWLLAFRLGARAGGRVAGAIAALALLASSDWLRYLSAGNVEPLVVALVLGAIELHLRGRRQGRVPARRAGRAGAPRGVAPRRGLRGLCLADRAALVAARARRPGHVRPVDRARLAGVG